MTWGVFLRLDILGGHLGLGFFHRCLEAVVWGRRVLVSVAWGRFWVQELASAFRVFVPCLGFARLKHF